MARGRAFFLWVPFVLFCYALIFLAAAPAALTGARRCLAARGLPAKDPATLSLQTGVQWVLDDMHTCARCAAAELERGDLTAAFVYFLPITFAASAAALLSAVLALKS